MDSKMMNKNNWKIKKLNFDHNEFMEKMGYKPRRRKKSHKWWESPFIDYDDPRTFYYDKK